MENSLALVLLGTCAQPQWMLLMHILSMPDHARLGVHTAQCTCSHSLALMLLGTSTLRMLLESKRMHVKLIHCGA